MVGVSPYRVHAFVFLQIVPDGRPPRNQAPINWRVEKQKPLGLMPSLRRRPTERSGANMPSCESRVPYPRRRKTNTSKNVLMFGFRHKYSYVLARIPLLQPATRKPSSCFLLSLNFLWFKSVLCRFEKLEAKRALGALLVSSETMAILLAEAQKKSYALARKQPRKLRVAAGVPC